MIHPIPQRKAINAFREAEDSFYSLAENQSGQVKTFYCAASSIFGLIKSIFVQEKKVAKKALRKKYLRTLEISEQKKRDLLLAEEERECQDLMYRTISLFLRGAF